MVMIERCDCMQMDGWKMDGLMVERFIDAREVCSV